MKNYQYCFSRSLLSSCHHFPSETIPLQYSTATAASSTISVAIANIHDHLPRSPSSSLMPPLSDCPNGVMQATMLHRTLLPGQRGQPPPAPPPVFSLASSSCAADTMTSTGTTSATTAMRWTGGSTACGGGARDVQHGLGNRWWDGLVGSVSDSGFSLLPSSSSSSQRRLHRSGNEIFRRRINILNRMNRFYRE